MAHVTISKTAILMLIASGLFLAACVEDDQARPGKEVTITFAGKSSSEYLFTLENPTSRSYFFRGERTLWLPAIPVDTGFTCKNEKTGEGTVAGAIHLLDYLPGHKDPPPMELLPGRAIKLRLIRAESGADLAKHQGETCILHIRLWLPGTSPQQRDQLFDSQAFQP